MRRLAQDSSEIDWGGADQNSITWSRGRTAAWRLAQKNQAAPTANSTVTSSQTEWGGADREFSRDV